MGTLYQDHPLGLLKQFVVDQIGLQHRVRIVSGFGSSSGLAAST